MKHMLMDVLSRLAKETKITLAGSRESILAISERVNRKTQTLRLHWRAAAIRHEMEIEHQGVGHMLCKSSSHDLSGKQLPISFHDIDVRLFESAATVQAFKKELHQIEHSIRNLEAEVLHEEFIHIQRDLSSRSAGMSRITMTSSSWVVGKSIGQLELPPTTKIACVLRGPILLSQTDETSIRSGDILILIGPQPEVQLIAEALHGSADDKARSN